MFTIDNLTVGYGAKNVLRGLSLAAEAGTVTGIVGYNGAGKTTLLDAIHGLVPAPREAFRLDGEVLRRTRVAYLPATNFFYSGITGRDYLQLFARQAPDFDPAPWQRILRLPLDDAIESYSTGMRKKLALTGVLAQNKPLVMLDEPFNGLDMESVEVLGIILGRLAERGRVVLVTSHIIESLTTVCHSIAMLAEGQIERSYARPEFDKLVRSLRDEAQTKYAATIDRALGGIARD